MHLPADHLLYIYEVATGAVVTYLTAPGTGPPVALASHPHHTIASATADGQVCLGRVGTEGDQDISVELHIRSVHSFACDVQDFANAHADIKTLPTICPLITLPGNLQPGKCLLHVNVSFMCMCDPE